MYISLVWRLRPLRAKRVSINSAMRPMKTVDGIVVAHHIQFSGVSCVTVVQRKKCIEATAVLQSVARDGARVKK